MIETEENFVVKTMEKSLQQQLIWDQKLLLIFIRF